MNKLLLSIILLPFAVANAEILQCSDFSKTVPVQSNIASANFFDNLWGLDNSIQKVAHSLLNSANLKIQSISPPPGICPRYCTISAPEIIFSAMPRKYLSEYEDKNLCSKYFQTTSVHPIIYKAENLKDMKAVAERFSELSQGDGIDGEDLYGKCDGSCSPSFKITLHPKQSGGFEEQSAVVCGHARDKDDNMYRLSTSIMWKCLKNR